MQQKTELDIIAKKARRMADITGISAMTWFRYLVADSAKAKGV